mgnify:CR=1 FL=1|tara:strand:- start:43 stop:303 length:261 start_codon:yes stop_codon:yes gene_type:complete
MDFQKVTTGVTAAAVIGTGATVGVNHQLDQMKGGPQKREDAQIERIREVVREEVYRQIVNAWPKTSGPVKGLVPPNKDYKQTIPKQ